MSKQVLIIGDTGDQLVNKFNNNSDDSYQTGSDLAIITPKVNNTVEYYNLLNNGCVGDANTDNTTAFNVILSTIGSNYATILIPAGRFLIGNCTIPVNVELVFRNGGRIIWKNNSTISISGYINAGHKWIFENQSEAPGDLSTIGIHQQEWISPMWFGGLMDGLDSSKTINYNAFRSVWNCAGRSGQVVNGGMIKFPAGVFITKGILPGTDGWVDNSKFTSIVGSGRTKTTIMLAASENKTLFTSYGYDYQIRDIGFDGGNQGSSGYPLLVLIGYRIDLINILITKWLANGIEFQSGQLNAIHIENFCATFITGISLKLEGVINATISGSLDMESGGTGIEVTSTLVDLDNSRYHSRVVINASWYAESLNYGLIIKGCGGVHAQISGYMRDTEYVLYLQYDTDRDIPSCFNYVDVRGTYDIKSTPTILIDNGCGMNTVINDFHMNLVDNDGSNSYGYKPRYERVLSSRVDTRIITPWTSPNYFAFGGDGVLVEGSLFNDIIDNDTDLAGPCHAYLPNTGVSGWSYALCNSGTMIEAVDHYIKIVVKAIPGTYAYLTLNANTVRYDAYRNKFRAPYNDYNFLNPIPEFTGDWQTLVIPIKDVLNPVSSFVIGIWGYGGLIEVAYCGVTPDMDAAITHRKNGVTVGHGYNNVYMASTSLPSANQVSVGTKNFCPDLGMEVISNGTNWKKPDGSSV